MLSSRYDAMPFELQLFVGFIRSKRLLVVVVVVGVQRGCAIFYIKMQRMHFNCWHLGIYFIVYVSYLGNFMYFLHVKVYFH